MGKFKYDVCCVCGGPCSGCYGRVRHYVWSGGELHVCGRPKCVALVERLVESARRMTAALAPERLPERLAKFKQGRGTQ